MAIARLAERQHGVVATWQLARLGYSHTDVRRRREAGRLHRIHRGVYAVGHRRLTTRGAWMAAVLACGPRAVLSHGFALALWELHRAPGGRIDVTVPGRTKRGQRGIRVHNVRRLDGDDRCELGGIPVTALPRTLLDCAEVSSRQRLRLALEEAERRELLDGNALDALLARSPGRRGHRPLTEALAAMRGPMPWTQSELEAAFLVLIREARIEEPQANVVVAGKLVDFYWPQQGLVVEVDGYSFHKTRKAFEADRRADARLQLAGCRVLRPTQQRIEHGPRELLRDVRLLLNAARRGAASDR